MKSLDRFLQRKRIEQARKYIQAGNRILDIGCDEGSLFKFLGNDLAKGVGIDPNLNKKVTTTKYELIPGQFPQDLQTSEKFDLITMLAVIEHFPNHTLKSLEEGCARLLDEKGKIIITVPSALTDYILKILFFFKIIDGMSLEEHHGFRPKDTITYFSNYFKLIKRKKFQFGLNNVFVLEKNKEFV